MNVWRSRTEREKGSVGGGFFAGLAIASALEGRFAAAVVAALFSVLFFWLRAALPGETAEGSGT